MTAKMQGNDLLNIIQLNIKETKRAIQIKSSKTKETTTF